MICHDVLDACDQDQFEPSPRRDEGEKAKRRVDDLIIPDTARYHGDASVQAMADSLDEFGQLQDVLVTPEGVVWDGVLRLAGAKLAGWDQINVLVRDGDDRRTEAAGLDANLVRDDLTDLDRGQFLLRQQEIYEELYPESKYGTPERLKKVRQGEPISGCPPAFTSDAAEKMGFNPRTVQKWVQTAKALTDVRDLLRKSPTPLNQGDLDKLAHCPEDEKRQIAEKLASGELTAVPKDAGRSRSWTPPDPDAVLRRVTTLLTGRLSGRPDADINVIPNAIKEIEHARSMWDPPTDEPGELPAYLSLDEIDPLPAGQLEIRWLDHHVVQIVKAGVPFARVAVRRTARSDQSFIRGGGEAETGLIDCCCFDNGGAEFGDVRIVLPDDGDPCLDGLVPPDRVGEIVTWRESCEPSSGDLSISLGLLQRWCESSPAHRFATVCADNFRPSDPMMAWLAALDNVVVGHSVSAASSPEQLASQFAVIQRFLDWGIRTVIWVVTESEPDDDPVVAQAILMVGADKVIVKPSRPAAGEQQSDVDHTNACWGRCRHCQIRCGLTVHGMMERRETAEPNSGRGRSVIHTPFPSPDRQGYEVICGDVREYLRSLEGQVHCVLTSPPHYGLKACGDSPLEIGRERDHREYVQTLCEVFDAVPLHPDGSVWVNLRDRRDGRVLLGIPERFMLAMQDRGWKLLDTVVWAKAALLPDGATRGETAAESAAWRLNGSGFEYMFRFSRTEHPWFDPSAARLPRRSGDGERYLPADQMILPMVLDGPMSPNVWLFASDRSGAAHLSPTPANLCEIPIALTCPLWVNRDGSLPRRTASGADRGEPEWADIRDDAEPGIVLDPFCGVGTSGAVALRLGRSFLGCELYEQHCLAARAHLSRTLRRLSGDLSVGDEAVISPFGDGVDDSLQSVTDAGTGGE